MNKKIIILLVSAAFILAVIVTALFSFFTREKPVVEKTTEVRVSVTEDGFFPATLSITRDMTVVWVNDTAKPVRIGANPYPDASSLPGLKSGDIAPGDSYSYTFTASGTFGYANYNEPTEGGSVQVQ